MSFEATTLTTKPCYFLFGSFSLGGGATVFKKKSEQHLMFFTMNSPPYATPMQPINTTVVQYTTVEIGREKQRDYIFYSLISLFYLGNPCCLGLAAMFYSIRARDRKVAGDIEGTKLNGTQALCLNIAATVLFCLLLLVFIITISVVLTRNVNYSRTFSNYFHHGY
nr:interferon-induced transmembrane protein 1 [Nerophis lumbriciformis]